MIKNRAPATVQVTAEQLLRDAQGRQEPQLSAPKQRAEDHEELYEYRSRKRAEFEKRIKQTHSNMKEWLRYASWEASQDEFSRSRSVYERALDVDHRSFQLWLSYTEMELKSRNIQHARNLLDRAVTLLPRVDQLWYRYVYLEELLQNLPGARQVFERWMSLNPDEKAWQAYIKLEQRYEEYDRASAIYERWVAARPEPRVWVKWGKFEEERKRVDKAREVFQTAITFFGENEESIDRAQPIFHAFAKMETTLKEYERARVIYKFALSRLSRSQSAILYTAYTKFERQYGTTSTIEFTIVEKRRAQYEDDLLRDGSNYDLWFAYIQLEEEALKDARKDGMAPEGEAHAIERVREIYERAVAQGPSGGEKKDWRRYVYLWLNYALFEELQITDYTRARQIFRTAIGLIPHKQFTFAKLWLLYAHFEVRRLDISAARKVLGTAIGMCAKDALFKGYIQLEIDLREFDRVRKLYEKYIEFNPTNSSTWVKYAELESQLGDFSRARAVFEMGIAQLQLSTPELLWKAYIDFEINMGEREKARALYERLLAVNAHVKRGDDNDDEIETTPGNPEMARDVFERALNSLDAKELEAEHTALLAVWKSFEGSLEASGEVNKLDLLLIQQRRKPDLASSRFVQMAHAWAASRAKEQ